MRAGRAGAAGVALIEADAGRTGPISAAALARAVPFAAPPVAPSSAPRASAPGLRLGRWLSAFALATGLSAAPSLAQEVFAPEAEAEVAPETGTAPVSDGSAVIISHGIATLGALKLPADAPHLPYVNPDAPKGGEISLGTFGGYDSLNPFTINGRSAVGASMMLETILESPADEIGASYCLLCTTMEYPEDRTWVIFNLRPEARFSDGTPLTAEDVVFSYETFLKKGLSDFRTLFAQQVEGAEALGPHRVKFTFKPGVPTRDLPQTVGGINVFSKRQFEAEKIDLEASSLRPFIGSGPYMVDRVDAGKSITYRRNPDHWGRDLPIMRGRANFDRIRYEYFGDPNAAFEAFKAGLYTFRQENTARLWAEGYDFPAARDGRVTREAIPSGDKASGQAFLFNLRRANWQDVRVREAIEAMFNFEWANRALFYGLYTRVDSFWENSWLAAKGAPTPEEVALLQPLVDEGLLPASILTEDPVSPTLSRTDRQLDRSNLRRAAALLDEAGWPVRSPPDVKRLGWGASVGIGLVLAIVLGALLALPALAGRRLLALGAAVLALAGFGFFARMDVAAPEDGLRRNAAGQTLRFALLENNPSFERVIAPFIENLRALGVDARLDMIDDAQYEVRSRNPSYDFDMLGFFTPTSYISGSELDQFYGSSTADISYFNKAGLKSPAVDRLVKVVMAAPDQAALDTATHALDRVLRHERFRIPMWYNAAHWVAHYPGYEHPETMPPWSLGVTDFWWYNPEAAVRPRGATSPAAPTSAGP